MITEFSSSYFLPDATFRFGYCLLKQNQPKPAAQTFESFLAEYPQHQFYDQALFWLAESELQTKNFDSASNHYNQLIQQYSSSDYLDDAAYGLGWIDLQQNRFSNAKDQFDKALGFNPDNRLRGEILLRKGDALYNLKSYQMAIRTYRQASFNIESNNLKAEPIFQIGQCYYRLGEFSSAVTEYQKIIDSSPESEYVLEARLAIGRSYFQSGKFDLAIGVFEELINRQPQSEYVDNALYTIGDCYYNLGNYAEAINAYEKMIRQYPKSPLVADAVSGIQWSMIQKGETAEALKVTDSYSELINNSGNAAEFQKRKAELFVNMNQYDNAIGIYRKIMEDFPESEEAKNAWYWIAEIYKKMDDSQLTEGALLNQTTKFPMAISSADALLELGNKSYLSQEFGKAMGYFQQLETDFKQTKFAPEASYKIGKCYLNLDRINQAESLYRKMLRLSPANPYVDYAQLGLAQVAITRRSYVDAQSYLDTIVGNRNDVLASEAQFLKGEVLYEQERYRDAALQYLKVKYLFGEYPFWIVRSVYSAALCYKNLENRMEAIKLFQSIQQNFPNSKFADLANQHINEITGR